MNWSNLLTQRGTQILGAVYLLGCDANRILQIPITPGRETMWPGTIIEMWCSKWEQLIMANEKRNLISVAQGRWCSKWDQFIMANEKRNLGQESVWPKVVAWADRKFGKEFVEAWSAREDQDFHMDCSPWTDAMSGRSWPTNTLLTMVVARCAGMYRAEDIKHMIFSRDRAIIVVRRS